jgi:hypothetical protein
MGYKSGDDILVEVGPNTRVFCRTAWVPSIAQPLVPGALSALRVLICRRLSQVINLELR